VLFEEKPAKFGKDARIEGLVRTLASLVTPHVEGILGDVTIIGPAGWELDRIADYAGCALLEQEGETLGFRRIFENLRYEQFLLLRSGYALKAEFIEEAGDLVKFNRRSDSTKLKLLSEPEDFVQRLFPGAAKIAGVIAPRSWALENSCCALSALMRKRRLFRSLRTRARRTI
jgi:hypothetical protein